MKILIGVFCGIGITYLMCAFVAWSWNPAYWEERVFATFLAFMFGGLGAIIGGADEKLKHIEF